MGAQQANAQSAMLRAQEQATARQGLAGVGAQQQGLGQQYGLGSQGQNIQEQHNLLEAHLGNQQTQLEANKAALAANSSGLQGMLGAAGGIASGVAGLI
jgi:hypothetical protein